MRQLILCCFSILLITSTLSCSKNKDDNSKSQLMVINAVPGSPGVSLDLNGQKLGDGKLDYKFSTGYKEILSGQRTLSVYQANTTNLLSGKTVSFAGGKSYTAILYTYQNTYALTFVEDNIPANIAGKAYVRFFHFAPYSPDAEQVGLNNEPLFADRKFETEVTAPESSKFTQVNTGKKSFQVRFAPNAIYANITFYTEVPLEEGKAYTVILGGWLGSNSTPPFLKYYQNN